LYEFMNANPFTKSYVDNFVVSMITSTHISEIEQFDKRRL